MNWKVLLTASVSTILLIFGGLFFLLKGGEEVAPSLRPAAPLEENQNSEDTGENVEDKNDDRSAQRKQDEETLRQSLENRTIGECDSIEDEQIGMQCHDGILLALALDDGNIEKCEQILDEKQNAYCRDQVLYFLARDKKEYGGCSQIQNDSTREKCTRLAERGLIYSARGFDDCAGISSTEFRKTCEERFPLIISQEEAEVDDCDFANDAKRRACEVERAAHTARSEGNIAACDEIINEDDHKSCLLRIQEMLNSEERDNAIRRGDTEDCLIIPDRGEQLFCLDRAYFVRAGNEYDVGLCEKIENETLRASCADKVSEKASVYFSQKAKKEKNPEWCEHIFESQAKISCRNFFQ